MRLIHNIRSSNQTKVLLKILKSLKSKQVFYLLYINTFFLTKLHTKI